MAFAGRYDDLPVQTRVLPDGREVRYRARRMLPPGDSLPLLAEVTIMDGERLDQIAARTLNDPLQSWRLCDANNAMHPRDLLDEPGRRLRVPLPELAQGH